MPKKKPEIPKATHCFVGYCKCGGLRLLMHDIAWTRKTDRDDTARSIADVIREGGRVERLAFGSPELEAVKTDRADWCNCGKAAA